ncbi:MAG: hypothetical protein RRA32_00410 [bacterium]|nr:hypothetical protein [bacterium]
MIETIFEILGIKNLVGNRLRRMWVSGGLYGLNQVIRKVLTQSPRDDGHESYTVDIDATAIEAGKKLARMTYKGFRGYTRNPDASGFRVPEPACRRQGGTIPEIRPKPISDFGVSTFTLSLYFSDGNLALFIWLIFHISSHPAGIHTDTVAALEGVMG